MPARRSTFVCAALAAGLAGAAGTGCHRRPKLVPAGPCPRPEALAAMVAAPGREVRTACAGYANAPYWMAGAVSYANGTGADARLVLLSGGQGVHAMAFDVPAVPTADLTRLVAGSDDVRARVTLTLQGQNLLRLGVWGRPRGRPDLLADEIAVVLQLVAHAPPRLLWAGAGDQTTKGADGCIVDHFVEFQMTFGQQLAMITRARGRPGCPPTGPGVQEMVGSRPVPLPPGRPAGP